MTEAKVVDTFHGCKIRKQQRQRAAEHGRLSAACVAWTHVVQTRGIHQNDVPALRIEAWNAEPCCLRVDCLD